MNNIALSVYCTVWSRGSSISAKIDRRVSIGCSPVQGNTPESLSSPHARPLLLMCNPPAHEPACRCPGCGGTTFSRIGQDEREVLEYVPSSFKVIRHLRPKLSCRSCETIVQAPMPSLPIERGRPGPGLIAHVLISKYCDHTPLHRQSVIYAREGVELDRATLADWVGQAEFLLAPLAEAIGRHARAGPVLHADDGSHRASAMGARHHRPSAGARPRQDQDRTIVGGRAGREALGIGRAAGSVLSLLA